MKQATVELRKENQEVKKEKQKIDKENQRLKREITIKEAILEKINQIDKIYSFMN